MDFASGDFFQKSYYRPSYLLTMDAGRLLRMLCLLCFLVFELVMGRPKCAGRWAIHSCGGGNGKRSEIAELLGDANPSEDDRLPGFVSDLKALGDRARDVENFPALLQDEDPSSISSDQLWDESPDEKIRSRVREDDARDDSDSIDRALDSLLARILLKRRLMG